MKIDKAFFKIFVNLLIFNFFIYLIVIGQKNIGMVKWVAKVINIDSLKQVGLCIMIFAILGLLLQLYTYNKKYQ